MPNAIFSKFVVPDANGRPTYLYEIKDAVARAAIAGGMKFVIAWDGESAPVVAKIPNTVTVIHNGTAYTGTLDPAVAHNNTPMGFWLVSNGNGGTDGFAEYIPVENTDVTPSVWRWEKIGNVALDLSSLGALAYMDSVELEKGLGANVIGENATLQAQDSNVTFGQHTTKNAIGTGATMNAAMPTLNGTRKRIKSQSVTPVDGTSNANVTLNPSKKKLKRATVTPAKAKTVMGSDLVTARMKKLGVTKINEPAQPSSVSIVSDATKRKMQTAPFPVTAPANDDPTVKGLDIRIYNPYVHGTIEGADEETLVFSFGTTPTLTLAQNPPARMATGGLVSDGNDGTQAHTDYVNEQGGEVVNNVTKANQNMVTSVSQKTVADGTLEDTEAGDTDTLVSAIDNSGRVNVAEPDAATELATGELVAQGESGYDTAPAGEGNELVTDASPTVTVPKAGTAVDVLLEEWANQADENADHINVLTDASLSGGGQVTVTDPDTVPAITGLGAATAAAQQVSFANKDLKKVALYDDLHIKTESHPATRYLNFLMPAGGGTVSLLKNGNVGNRSLEYSLDGVNWQTWTPNPETGNRSRQLAAGERLYVRSSSPTTTAFSSGSDNYYQFSVPDGTEVNGIVESLLCRTPELGEIGNTTNANCHFANLFRNCHITGRPVINSKVVKTQSLENMFRNTAPLNTIEVHIVTRASGSTAQLSGWLLDCAASGTIYAPASLTLTNNSSSGLPSGWTRVDID